MVKLDPSTINEFVEILKPFVETEKERRSFLIAALGNDASVLQRISWDDSVAIFIPDMLSKLADFGGKQAFCAVLEFVQSQMSVHEDVQQRIDKLIRQLNLPASTTNDIDGLVQKVRKGLYDRIKNLHGTIQLLDIAHPVEIDRLYVDVNILEEPCSYSRLEIGELLRGRDQREDFNRFGLSKVRERVTGLQAVKKYAKLMILGKPGSGKTTFLQHVVIECNQGYLLADRIPILIRLRDFVRQAKRVSNFSFDSHINSYLREVASQQEVTALLSAGKFLLLLDGLDEIPKENSDAVVDEIEFFIENYDQNNFIITCRVQAQKYRLNRFNYVEIADFNSEQIVKFTQKWFTANSRNRLQEAEKSSKLIELFNLVENQKIKELAVTPILLSLTCRIFDDKGKFYSKPSELYEQGLEILLSKWDDSRRIKRYSVYQNLSIEQKRKLLTYLAARKFEQEQYMLFEQDEIQVYIAEYLDISLEDSQVVIESIESQHGLIVERAQRIYSFSHLTFQEYFTAKWFIDHADWQGLINHVTDKHWREVFLLVVGMIKNAEEVLLMMKQKIDYIASDEKLQQFLAWLHQKFISVKAVYKPASLRAFCLSLVLSPPELNFVLATDRFDTFSLSWNIDKAINPLGFDGEPDYNFIEFSRIFNPEIEDLFQTLQNQGFRGQCSEVNKSQKYFEQWWRTNGHIWTKEYRDIILEHHNISHSLQFSVRQKELLQQYYDANKLLLDCLNNNCVVSNAIRQEIENSLLLPIAEFENTRSSGFIPEQ